MIDRKRPPQIYVIVALALFLALVLSAKGLAAEAHNVRLVGYYDLQQRPALQIVLKGDFAYVGHHSGTATNPLSGKREPNGTSIVNVSDPSQPKIIHHIPGYTGAESRAVQVVEDFYEGRDFLLRNQESGDFTGFEITQSLDVTKPNTLFFVLNYPKNIVVGKPVFSREILKMIAVKTTYTGIRTKPNIPFRILDNIIDMHGR